MSEYHQIIAEPTNYKSKVHSTSMTRYSNTAYDSDVLDNQVKYVLLLPKLIAGYRPGPGSRWKT